MKKDKDNLTEEEKKEIEEALKKKLVAALEKDPEYQKRRNIAMMFSYGLHPNFLIHIILLLGLNFVTVASALGVLPFIVINNPLSLSLGVVLFTFIELSIKMLITRLLQRKHMYSVGLVDLIVLIPLFYFCLVYPKAIVIQHVWELIVCLLLFLILRFFAAYYIRKFFFRRVMK